MRDYSSDWDQPLDEKLHYSAMLGRTSRYIDFDYSINDVERFFTDLELNVSIGSLENLIENPYYYSNPNETVLDFIGRISVFINVVCRCTKNITLLAQNYFTDENEKKQFVCYHYASSIRMLKILFSMKSENPYIVILLNMLRSSEDLLKILAKYSNEFKNATINNMAEKILVATDDSLDIPDYNTDFYYILLYFSFVIFLDFMYSNTPFELSYEIAKSNAFLVEEVCTDLIKVLTKAFNFDKISLPEIKFDLSDCPDDCDLFYSDNFTLANPYLIVKNFKFSSAISAMCVKFASSQYSIPIRDFPFELYLDLPIRFINCYFDSSFFTFTTGKKDKLFLNCVFSKNTNLDFISSSISKTEFDNCLIEGNINIKHCDEDGVAEIYIHDSFFTETSNFKICDFESSMLGCRILIENCLFNGNVCFSNIQSFKEYNHIGYVSIKLSNITFNGDVIMDNCVFKLKEDTKNIAFSVQNQEKFEKNKAALYNAFVKNGFHTEAKRLGLEPIALKPTIVVQKPEEEMNLTIEIKSGYLTPKSASKYLGVSLSTLAKKRSADKEHITRESIPYIGEGKSIRYPVDALDAFKSQNWSTLKELRSKYANFKAKDILEDE